MVPETNRSVPFEERKGGGKKTQEITDRFLRSVRPDEDFQFPSTHAAHTFANFQPHRSSLMIVVDLPEQQRRIRFREPRHIDAVLIAQPDGSGERGRDKRVGRQR